MKTIALVANSAWNLYNFRLNLARALKNEGYNVVCVAPLDALYAPKIEKEFAFYAVPFDAQGMNPMNDLKTLWRLFRLYRKLRPDIVLNYTVKPNLYSALTSWIVGAKSINNVSGLGTLFIRPTLATFLVKMLYRLVSFFTCKVFFQNEEDYYLFKKAGLVRTEQGDVIPGSGVDLKRFFPKVHRDKDGKVIFLLVARMLRDKGIVEFMEAGKMLVRKYPFVECQLLGAFNVANPTALSKEDVMQRCVGWSCRYLGENDAVEDVIAQADCVVLPSYREGTPRSLLEASAMAKPIIATNVVGCRNVVEEGITGFLCRVCDSKDLMTQMEKIVLMSDIQRTAMGEKGRLKMQNEFDEEIVIEHYLKAIKELLTYN